LNTAEEREGFNALEWVEDNFEDPRVCAVVLRRVGWLTMFTQYPGEYGFMAGLSIGVELGRKLGQIETLNEQLDKE